MAKDSIYFSGIDQLTFSFLIFCFSDARISRMERAKKCFHNGGHTNGVYIVSCIDYRLTCERQRTKQNPLIDCGFHLFCGQINSRQTFLSIFINSKRFQIILVIGSWSEMAFQFQSETCDLSVECERTLIISLTFGLCARQYSRCDRTV